MSIEQRKIYNSLARLKKLAESLMGAMDQGRITVMDDGAVPHLKPLYSYCVEEFKILDTKFDSRPH